MKKIDMEELVRRMSKRSGYSFDDTKTVLSAFFAEWEELLKKKEVLDQEFSNKSSIHLCGKVRKRKIISFKRKGKDVSYTRPKKSFPEMTIKGAKVGELFPKKLKDGLQDIRDGFDTLAVRDGFDT